MNKVKVFSNEPFSPWYNRETKECECKTTCFLCPMVRTNEWLNSIDFDCNRIAELITKDIK